MPRRILGEAERRAHRGGRQRRRHLDHERHRAAQPPRAGRVHQLLGDDQGLGRELQPGDALEAVRLVTLRNVKGGLPVQMVAAPSAPSDLKEIQ